MRRLAVIVLAACSSFEEPPTSGPACPDKAFCDDFERESLVGGWSTQGGVAGATVALDDTTSANGKKSVRFDVAPDSPEGRLHLTRDIGENATKLVISFATKMTANVNLTFFTFELGPNRQSEGFYDTIYLATGDTGVELREVVNDASGFKTEGVAVASIPSDHFARFTLTIDLAAKTAVYRDDTSTVEVKKTLNLPHAKPRELRLGVAYTAGNARPAKASLWFDDVIVEQ